MKILQSSSTIQQFEVFDSSITMSSVPRKVTGKKLEETTTVMPTYVFYFEFLVKSLARRAYQYTKGQATSKSDHIRSTSLVSSYYIQEFNSFYFMSCIPYMTIVQGISAPNKRGY